MEGVDLPCIILIDTFTWDNTVEYREGNALHTDVRFLSQTFHAIDRGHVSLLPC